MARDKAVKDPLAPRVSKVTKPAVKAKLSGSKVQKKAYTSAEKVTASDDEDMEPAPSISKSTTKGLKATSSSDEESSSDDSEDDEETREASKKRIEQLAKGNGQGEEDSESASDEDEDESRGNASGKSHAPTPSRSTVLAAAPTPSR